MKTLSDLRPVPVGLVTQESLAVLERRMLAIVRDSDSFESRAPYQALTAASYHLGSGGQRVRGMLALHAGNCLGLTPADSQTLAATCELLHNASLIHDDLHDRDILRRGKSSVWHRFGDDVAICAGDLLLSASYLALSQLTQIDRLPALFALMHRRISSAIRGQCTDLKRPTHRAVTIDDFNNIARIKSGALLSLPTELALLAAGESLALGQARQAAESFAIAYQIYDDLLDVEKDTARNAVKNLDKSQSGNTAVCNIVIILQADPNHANAQAAAVEIGLQHLLMAASASIDLPLHSGDALHTMSLQLQEKLESLE
jgi:geranylgeranyl pyrophosphate synthase